MSIRLFKTTVGGRKKFASNGIQTRFNEVLECLQNVINPKFLNLSVYAAYMNKKFCLKLWSEAYTHSLQIFICKLLTEFGVEVPFKMCKG